MVTKSTSRNASVPQNSNLEGDQLQNRSYGRTVKTEPLANSWMVLAVGGTIPLGLAGAATLSSYLSKNERVSIAAWVAVAVVGTASVISSAAVSHRRTVSIERDGQKPVEKLDHKAHLHDQPG